MTKHTPEEVLEIIMEEYTERDEYGVPQVCGSRFSPEKLATYLAGTRETPRTIDEQMDKNMYETVEEMYTPSPDTEKKYHKANCDFYRQPVEDITEALHHLHVAVKLYEQDRERYPVAEQEYKDFINRLAGERQRIITIINKHKALSQSDGSYKHDDCYDALLEEI